MRRLIARFMCLVLTLAMVLGMSVTGYADEKYSIKVSGSVSGSTYYVYIILDATYDGTGNVSYTTPADSYWYGKMSDETSPFELGADNGNGVQVTLREGVDGEDIAAWIRENLGDSTGGVETHYVASGDGNGSDIEIDVGTPGYYYVSTGSGSLVSLTTADPSATIYDKNLPTPGLDLTKATNGAGNSYLYDDGREGSRRRVYTVKTSAPTQVDGVNVDTYTLTDTLGDGLWTADSYVGVLLLGADEVTEGSMDNNYLGNITEMCGITVSDQVLTVTWMPNSFDEVDALTYPSNARVMVIYQATLTTGADELNLTNDVTLSWTLEDGGSEVPDDGWPEDSVWDGIYGFVLSKTSTNGDSLEGAEFTLSKTNDDGDTEWILWDSTDEDDTFIAWHSMGDGTGDTYHLTSGGGTVNVWGLSEGTYTLTETKAPAGYNVLDNPVTIEIAYDSGTWTVTYWDSGDDNPIDDITRGTKTGTIDDSSVHGVGAMPTVVIQNTSGTRLPSTGGMGTYLFYLVGGILAILGGALLVTRWRLRKED